MHVGDKLSKFIVRSNRYWWVLNRFILSCIGSIQLRTYIKFYGLKLAWRCSVAKERRLGEVFLIKSGEYGGGGSINLFFYIVFVHFLFFRPFGLYCSHKWPFKLVHNMNAFACYFFEYRFFSFRLVLVDFFLKC